MRNNVPEPNFLAQVAGWSAFVAQTGDILPLGNAWNEVPLSVLETNALILYPDQTSARMGLECSQHPLMNTAFVREIPFVTFLAFILLGQHLIFATEQVPYLQKLLEHPWVKTNFGEIQLEPIHDDQPFQSIAFDWDADEMRRNLDILMAIAAPIIARRRAAAAHN